MIYDPAQVLPEVQEGSDAAGGISTNARLTVGEEFHGNISSASDKDWVEIHLEAGETYVFTVWGVGGNVVGLNDSKLSLHDSSGAVLAESKDINSNVGNYFSRVSFTADQSGTYYLEVGSEFGGSGDYILEAATDVFTVDQVVNQIAEHGWGYSAPLAFDHSNISVNLQGLTADGKEMARAALRMWEETTSLTFTETSGSADITFDDNKAGAFAGPSAFNPATGVISTATVNVSTNWLQTYGTTIGSYSYLTYLHEIGHALGLYHGGEYDGVATYGQDNHYRNDSYQMSIMTYFNLTENTFVDGSAYYPLTPMVADVAAMEQLYGTSKTLNGGDTIWGSGSNVGGILGDAFGIWFDGETQNLAEFSDGLYFGFTVVDHGGNDVLDLSKVSAAQKIDLREGRASDIGGYTGNMVMGIGSEIEKVTSGSGNDGIYAHSAGSVVNGGAGKDTIIGNLGDDTLSGDGGEDLVKGEGGNDLLFGGGGYDTIHGGIGNDTIAGDDGRDLIWLDAGDDVFNDNGQAGTHGQDTVHGGAGNDLINGGGGNDKLYGGGNYDTIHGGAGNDIVYGDDGRDTVWLGGGNDVFHDNGQAGTHGQDTVYGGAGNDVINGGGGNDKFYGGGNYDTIRGGSGNDTVYGDNGRDTVWLDAGNDVFHDNGQNDTHGKDVVYGGAGNDVINGGGGDDLFYGGANYDTIHGGIGNDTVYGDNGRDTVWLGDGNDVFHDNGQNDTHGQDVVHGGDGNDTINAGGGDDLFYGDAGSDTFVWDASALSGNDTIMDFEDGVDVLEISNTTYSGLTIQANGEDTQITWANGSLTLTGIDANVITEDDFIFS